MVELTIYTNKETKCFLSARTTLHWQGITVDSISDKYVTNVHFDEFIFPSLLVLLLIKLSLLISKRIPDSRVRFVH